MLYSSLEGHAVRRILAEVDRVHIETPADEGNCLYESVLCGDIPAPLAPKVYTVDNFKNQIFMYMIENPAQCTELLKERLQAYKTCLSNYIVKFLGEGEWGEEYLLLILHAMWGLKITVVDVTATVVERNFGHSGGTTAADVVIVYNGTTHYTATG